MRLRATSLCLLLLFTAFDALGCSGLSGSATGASQQDTTTAAPTTTTTLSPAQVALGSMNVRQKAAQVLLLAFSGTSLSADTAALLAAGPPGGLLILGYNFADQAQMRALTAALQQAAAASGLPVGLLIAVDQEGGKVRRITQGLPDLPSARSLGEDSTPSQASELARQTASGLLDLGINMNLAPVADVVSDKGSFLYDRSYSGDAALVSSFVTAVIQASQGQGLICVAKHFPGHGSASQDTHDQAAISSASAQDFESIHLPPFSAAISAGVEGIMVSHVIASAYDADNPASLSQVVVTGLLRDHLGFTGLIVADDLAMAAALDSGAGAPIQQISTAKTAADAKVTAKLRTAVAALNAGCDLLILTGIESDAIALLDALVAAIEQGQVSQSRLDEAVARILDLKYRHGIIAPPVPSTTTTTERPEEMTS
jgi:beta-N-acetylhexosaminidase